MTNHTSTPDTATPRFLARPEGRIAYDLTGTGPLVVLVPGMGDLRSTWRHLTPALAAAGHTVVTTDLRGHGDSDATFTDHGDEPTADDLLALVAELGGPAVLVGNSMAAGAAVIAAARRPDLVSGLVLVGPFVRDGAAGALQRLLFRVAMARPWARRVWLSYLPSLYAGRRPEDLDAHLAAVGEALRRPGRTAAFVRTTRTSHRLAATLLPEVTAPVLVVMGEADPDFGDPAAEAAWIASRTGGEVCLVPDAGHYPQSQRPDVVAPAVTAFLARVTGA